MAVVKDAYLLPGVDKKDTSVYILPKDLVIVPIKVNVPIPADLCALLAKRKTREMTGEGLVLYTYGKHEEGKQNKL